MASADEFESHLASEYDWDPDVPHRGYEDVAGWRALHATGYPQGHRIVANAQTTTIC
jgi:hypothetical protein